MSGWGLKTVGLVAVLLGAVALTASAAEVTQTFENINPGALPAGWKADVSRSPDGAIYASCAVENVTKAASGDRALAIIPSKQRSVLQKAVAADVLNLCWTPTAKYLNLEFESAIRAESGATEQGGGLIWRVQNTSNYYLARYNPLDHVFRLFVVRDGARKTLASAEGLKVGKGEWFTIKIVHQGDAIQGWFNGQKLIDIRDTGLNQGGGVGLWTRVDGNTLFDDVRIKDL